MLWTLDIAGKEGSFNGKEGARLVNYGMGVGFC